jgi:hypothetical protein
LGSFEHILKKLHELQLLVGTLSFFPVAFYNYYTSHGLLKRQHFCLDIRELINVASEMV